MDASPVNGLLGTLQAQQDWPRLAEAAQRLANSQPNNGEAWRYWGIAEMMLMRGGPDKLLRASLLNDFEVGALARRHPGICDPPDRRRPAVRVARAGRDWRRSGAARISTTRKKCTSRRSLCATPRAASVPIRRWTARATGCPTS